MTAEVSEFWNTRIPQNWDEITPAWIGPAIARRHPGAEVCEVTVLDRDDGTNRRVRLGLRYSSGAGPATLFLKSNDPAHRSVHLRNGNLFNEAQLFSTPDAPLHVDHPHVYRSLLDRQEASFLLVMEDIKTRHADPRDALRPLSSTQVAQGLRGLARLHSHYWDFTSNSHPQLAWVQTWAATDGWLVGLRKRIPIGLERAAELLPQELRGCSADTIVGYWERYVNSLATGHSTLLHGDAHIGNTYVLPEGDVGFLDWQVVRRGEWSQDVGYFLAGSLTVEDRRNHERDLLDIYREAMTLPMVQRPTPEAVWSRYCASQAYGLAIWLSTLGTDGWQAPAVSRTLVERYASAFVDLESEKAL